MQNSNIKADKFQEFLTANQITCFGVQEMNDAVHTVIFAPIWRLAASSSRSCLLPMTLCMRRCRCGS